MRIVEYSGQRPISDNDIELQSDHGPIVRTWRWVMTTTTFLLLLAAAAATISFWVSLSSGQWHWFQRSGALVVSIGVVLSTRRLLRTCIGDVEGCNQFDGAIPATQGTDGEVSKDSQAAFWGFWTVATGTLIWAYGDLIEYIFSDVSCCG